MKKVILSLSLLLFLSCSNGSQIYSDKNLTIIVKNVIENFPDKIDFINIRNLDYDQLLILEPYTDINKTAKELQVDLSNISENTIHSSDDFNLLIFLKNNKSIKIVELSRKNGDFKDYKIVIDYKSAIFERDDNGIIVLKNNTN